MTVFFARLLLAVFAVVLQISILSPLGVAHMLSLPLVLIIYFTLMTPGLPSHWIALITGALLDLASPFPFGLHMVSLTIASVVTEMLFLNFFTNRSIYAIFALTFAATILSTLVWYGGGTLLALIEPNQYRPPILLLTWWLPVGNLLAAAFLFYLHLVLRSATGRYFLQKHGVAARMHE